MKNYKFIEGEPEEGTLVLGVVYHVIRETDISRLVKFANEYRRLFEEKMDAIPPVALNPIGYVGEEMTPEMVFGKPEAEEDPLYCGCCYKPLNEDRNCPYECD